MSKTCDYDISKVKEIADISRSGVEIETKLIALAAWMKSNYGGTMLQSLKTVLPIKEKENIKVKKAAQTADRPGDGGKTASLLSGKESESEGASDGGAS